MARSAVGTLPHGSDDQRQLSRDRYHGLVVSISITADRSPKVPIQRQLYDWLRGEIGTPRPAQANQASITPADVGDTFAHLLICCRTSRAMVWTPFSMDVSLIGVRGRSWPGLRSHPPYMTSKCTFLLRTTIRAKRHTSPPEP